MRPRRRCTNLVRRRYPHYAARLGRSFAPSRRRIGKMLQGMGWLPVNDEERALLAGALDTCAGNRCRWPLSQEQWLQQAIQRGSSEPDLNGRGWPECSQCGIDLVEFIDICDLPHDLRTRGRSFRLLMDKRHRDLAHYLVEEARRELGDKFPSLCAEGICGYFEADDATGLPPVPRGEGLYTQQSDKPHENAAKPLIWTTMRMAGWKLWWSGGKDIMRLAEQQSAGVSVDYIWNGIGVGDDFWQS